MFIIRKIIEYNLKWVFIPIVSSIMLFLPYIFWLIGLSSIGPIAGGLFATMQGTGIISGSLMAMTQSFAMSGWIVVMQLVAISSWVIVLIFTFINNIYFMIKYNRCLKCYKV
jgi:hypothetical protein